MIEGEARWFSVRWTLSTKTPFVNVSSQSKIRLPSEQVRWYAIPLCQGQVMPRMLLRLIALRIGLQACPVLSRLHNKREQWIGRIADRLLAANLRDMHVL